MTSRILKGLWAAASGKNLRGVWRFLYLTVFWIPTFTVAAVVCCNSWLMLSTRAFIHEDVASVMPEDVGLVLGTSKKLAPGKANEHFQNRIDTAVTLYLAGKVRHLLVSGDNGSKYYNEPRDMRQALEAHGVAPEDITCDFAGFRTLDSMVRAKEIFGVRRLTVISDGFHLPRAVFIGQHLGLEVQGVAGKRVDLKKAARTEVREWLARVKAVLDLYILNTEPRFLGEKEPILV